MSEINVKPLGARVLVQPVPAETVTASGIIIPDTAKEKPQQGKVLAVGTSDEIEVKVGDTVLYGKFAGTEFTHNGEKYLIIDQSDLFATL